MKLDSLIDSFVHLINSTDRERLLQDEVPLDIRDGEPDGDGFIGWKIREADCKERVDAIELKSSKQFPPSFYSFVSRYSFPAFQLGPIFFYGNTGQGIYYELEKRLFEDEHMASQLFQSGYLQIGNPFESNYDPVCFDTNKVGESPIVQIDHEEILCNSRIKIIKEIAPSFLHIAQEFVEMKS